MIDLSKWTGEQIIVSEPWSDDTYSYASTGAILIRVDRQPGVDTTSLVDTGRFVYDPMADYGPLPVYADPEKQTCSICKGSGKTQRCPECDGQGNLDFHSGHNWYNCECNTCGGEGVVAGDGMECESCQGKGWEYKNPPPFIDVVDVRLNILQLERIKELPGVVINLEPQDGGFVRFRFDGGCGFLMLMQKD